MNHVTAILSMLHESAVAGSASRRFRNKPVLEWTLTRVARAGCIDSTSILHWDDQRDAIDALRECHPAATFISKGERQSLPGMNAIPAARRWADGWRGGLLGTCEFDLGFHPEWVSAIAKANEADAVLLI